MRRRPKMRAVSRPATCAAELSAPAATGFAAIRPTRARVAGPPGVPPAPYRLTPARRPQPEGPPAGVGSANGVGPACCAHDEQAAPNFCTFGSNLRRSETTMSLQVGSQGKAVADVQNALKRGGFLSGPADGRFGATTGNAVRAFQTSKGLTADGVVGQQTWAALGLKGSVPRPVKFD